MKAFSLRHFAVLGALVVAGVWLAAGATGQSPAPSLGPSTGAVAETAWHPTMGNPAAVYCRDMGYEYEIEDAEGQRGFCTLPDGQVCDAWAFLQGKCGQSYSYCAQQGYDTMTRSDGQDPFSPEYAVCVTGEGTVAGSVTELSNLGEKATGCGGEAPTGEMTLPFEEEATYVPPVDADPPASFDWRTYLGYDWMSPVKNQGGCGSCWAFSAVGATEAAHNIASNNPNLDLDLSEQYLVADCSDAGSCCGGNKAAALRYIRDYGIPDEGCMPYVDGTGCSCDGGTCDSVCVYSTDGNCSDKTCSNRCSDWSSRLTQITSTDWVGTTDQQAIKQWLVDTGPLAVSMAYGPDFGGYFDRNDDDIYRCTLDTGPTQTNHAVVAVGYNDDGEYWIIKNSWGTGWEDGGYFKIGYGECYIEQRVYYADASVPDVGPLVHDSHIIDDDMSTSIGDDDGIVDCGETIELNVILRNQGTDSATGVAASLSTTDAYIYITDSQEDFPDIPGGGTGEDLADYDFVVDPGTPDGHIIQFDLNIAASNGGPWTDSFDVPVSCSTNSPPYTPSGPSPADGATGVPVTADLAWTGGDPDPGDTVTYDVYLGTANPPTTLLYNDIASTTCDPGTLSDGTPYYWTIVATDNHGASTDGPVWDFTTAAGGDAYEPDDAVDQASTIDDGSPQTHSIVPAGDVDWVTFTLNAESEVVLETSGATGDTQLWLYDSGQNQLDYDDDGGTGYFSRIERVCGVDALPAGTYYVKIKEYGDNDEIPSYQIALTVQGCASEVGPLEYHSHVIDDDTYNESFGDGDGIVDCGETIELWVDLINRGSDAATLVDAAISTSDPYVTWPHNTSSEYPEIAGGGIETNLNDFDFAVSPDAPDGHMIQFDLNITAYNEGPWTDSFSVPVACLTACNDPGEPNDAPGQAVPMAYGSVLSGRDICPAGDVDYYSFAGNAGDTILADIDAWATGSDLDSYLILYGTDGVTELTRNDDFDGLDSLIAYTLPAAGTYYLKVREYSDPIEGGPAYTYRISLVELEHRVYLPVTLRNRD